MAVDHTFIDAPGPRRPSATDAPGRPDPRPGPGRAGRPRPRPAGPPEGRSGQRLWRATWPKLIAFGLILLVWQIAVWAHWRPYILQSPATVARQLWDLLGHLATSGRPAGPRRNRRSSGTRWSSSSAASSAPRWPGCRVLRAGIGALITGMQTMPSVLWYPLGYMVFGVHNCRPSS